MKVLTIQPAFLVKRSCKLELLHRNTWKIVTRNAVSFACSLAKGYVAVSIDNYLIVKNNLSNWIRFKSELKMPSSIFKKIALNKGGVSFFDECIPVNIRVNFYKTFIDFF